MATTRDRPTEVKKPRVARTRAEAPHARSINTAATVAAKVAPTKTHAQWYDISFVEMYRASPTVRIEVIRRGVPAQALVAIAKTLGRSKERVVTVLGLASSTINRKLTRRQVLSTEESERVVGFAKLVGQIQVMVEQSGEPAGFDAARWMADWMDVPIPALDGKAPADYLDTAEGRELLSGLLAKMQSGAYA